MTNDQDNTDAGVTTLLPPKMIAEALGEAKEVGDGYMCRCPVHDDNKASMWISQSGAGRTVVMCHACCDTQNIEAVLERKGLWKAKLGRPARADDNYVLEQAYRYLNTDGTYVFTKRRLRHKTDGSKMFPQCVERPGQPDMNRLPRGTDKPLFLAPKIKNADPKELVITVEGEKDVKSLEAHGFLATCHPDGAGGVWRDQQVAPLRGRDAILNPDNDDPGRVDMHRAARILQWVVQRIRRVELPDVPEKGDISDWFYLGDDNGQAELLALIQSALDMDENAGVPGLDWRTRLLKTGGEVPRPLSTSANPLSTRTMQRWRLEGVGPTYVKLGRLVRYRKSDLELFLEERTCTSTSSAVFANGSDFIGGRGND